MRVGVEQDSQHQEQALVRILREILLAQKAIDRRQRAILAERHERVDRLDHLARIVGRERRAGRSSQEVIEIHVKVSLDIRLGR